MIVSRRTIIGTVAVVPVLGLGGLLGGCAQIGGFNLVDAIRRLLSLSSSRAFASLVRENGFLDDQVARISLPAQLGGGTATSIVGAILTSGVMRERLTRQVNRAAEKGAELAAPVVADAILKVGIPGAAAIIAGGGNGATDLLRGAMGDALIGAMLPGVDNGLKLFDNGIIAQVLGQVTGINFAGLRDDITRKASDGIYNAIAREERAIRANPASTGDPLLIATFSLAR